jgi:release factor glutamine methyltransferase
MEKEELWLLEEKYDGMKSDAFFEDLKRLQSGEPLAYILGNIPFLDCTIYLDSKPLIPRPETEFWTQKAIQTIADFKGQTPSVLDLCAGSGAIGVAIAKAIPSAQVSFVEVEPAHISTINKNIEENTNHLQKNSYTVFCGDLFDAFRHNETTFDFILTNPPYIDKAQNTVEESVTNHEPHLALFGGEDGLYIIIKIITTAKKYLRQNGELWVEHEPFQSEAIVELGVQMGFDVHTQVDQYNIERWSILVLK